MVSKRIQKALLGNSAIRAMFVEGKAMAEKYGAENVYDFSLGNPATPAPAALNDSIRDLLDEADKKGAAGSLELHGYMENAGYKDVREAIAANLNKRFGTAFDDHNIVMTVGAAGGKVWWKAHLQLTHLLRAGHRILYILHRRIFRLHEEPYIQPQALIFQLYDSFQPEYHARHLQL